MIRTIFAATALAALAACVSSEAVQTVSFDGNRFRQLTGERLRSAIVGKAIQYTASPDVITSPRCDLFYPDGQYVTCGDRVPFLTGTYEVRNDRVCAVTVTERCWQLYTSNDGRYLLGHLGRVPEFFLPVTLESPPEQSRFN